MIHKILKIVPTTIPIDVMMTSGGPNATIESVVLLIVRFFNTVIQVQTNQIYLNKKYTSARMRKSSGLCQTSLRKSGLFIVTID
jgi:hypothetical protein